MKKIIYILFLIFFINSFAYSQENPDKIIITKRKLIFIAETIHKFEKESGKLFKRFAQIRKYIPDIDDKIDSWGNHFFIDSDEKIIGSFGKDKKKSNDDILVSWEFPNGDIEIIKTKNSLEKLRKLIVYYNKISGEIQFLTDLDKFYSHKYSNMVDSWNLPFVLDTEENTILSTGPNRLRENPVHLVDDIVFSYDTNSIQVKILETKKKLKKLSKIVEEFYRKNHKLPVSINALKERCNVFDSWNRKFRIDKKKNFIYSLGKDGLSNNLFTSYDDIKTSFSTHIDVNRGDKLLLKKIGRETLKFKMFKNRFPNSLKELKAYDYCKNIKENYDSYGNKIIFSDGKIIFPGENGRVDKDDLTFDCNKIDELEKIKLTKEVVDFIADRVIIYKIDGNDTLENLLQLRDNNYLPDIYTMRDGWSGRYYIDTRNNFVYSMGPDKKHSLNYSKNWNDDITSECSVNSLKGKRIYEHLKKKIIAAKVAETENELRRLAIKLRIRDKKIGRRKLIYRRLGKELKKELKSKRDPFGKLYNLNFRKKIIYSSGVDMIKNSKDDIKICWRNVKLPNSKSKRKSKRRKKRRKKRRRGRRHHRR